MKVLMNSYQRRPRISSSIDPVEVYAFHKCLPGYKPTPLISLKDSAKNLGAQHILIKDEGKRFGLKAFKALGASYAVYRILHEKSQGHLKPDRFISPEARDLADGITFYCATDGNHGRAVAWIAKLLKRPAVIFVPSGTVAPRIKAIESEGAEVITVNGGYDEAVRRAGEMADGERHLVIADTSYPGYSEIPLYIHQGYLTMFFEISLQLKEQNEKFPDLVILQAGVGAFASSAATFFSDLNKRPCLVSVEPESAECLFHSAEIGDGKPHSFISQKGTIMAGLNCETPSQIAWPIIRDSFDAFLSIEDHYTEEAMKILAHEGVVSGESGAAGLAALIGLNREFPDFIEKKLLTSGQSTILIINTEADTDPEGYQKIVGKSSHDILPIEER